MEKIKPIIGIIARPAINFEGPNELFILEKYRTAVIKSGGIPIGILPTQDLEYEENKPSQTRKLEEKEKKDLIVQIKMCDGIILSGGNKFYEYDEFICEYAMKQDVPLLGICAGMQAMARMDNRKKYEDYRNIRNDTQINHYQMDKTYVHTVDLKQGSFLKEIIGEDSIKVNSVHNYHISKTNEFTISAVSEDGFIEAIEMKDKKFMIGVQWHPEKMLSYDKTSRKLLESFVEVCKK